ncbi:putative lipid phosphate phosphatase 3, chloroplastic isoform X2 [Malania oleifera]|uniref:putative lipid phosphate phosphatase 3, chloroplastic isoform X2 n=1 Tax=Malania oleifera TaxID=397392 RepID=UPI0025AEAEB0|nr:putative lipid phosphate phosphatase 3, chloroplastic isoform X2 [Malania oleifera]XP_057962058.1 putative lipid phosphate phosphatase 3, chloroplastic isoform X2 [Malania oleifera]XP_057962060.1 putative lipid phosphate phosphatase 3, chloroplastic isoform X2 [Malania oleifera]
MAWRVKFQNFQRIFQGSGMREVELGAHTIRSHGATVARDHMHDWLILLLLVVIEMYAVLLPIAIFILFYFRRRDVYDLHHGILGLLFSVLITAVITDAIKNAVGRPRPDFFWRCFPDGKDSYDRWGNAICHGEHSVIREGHKSFPSGHTSWSFAGLGFLSLYLSGKIKVFDRRGHVAKLCIVFLPLLAASLVAISRVDDYWHHWQDVFAAGLLGLFVATICYLQFFPPPYDTDGWGPYAYFRALEDSQTNAQAVNSANVFNIQAMETQVMNTEARRNTNTFVLPVEHDSGSPFDELESGRPFGASSA